MRTLPTVSLTSFVFVALVLWAIHSATAGSLYVTTAGAVDAVDETTGAVTTIVSSGLTDPRGIAFNPVNGHFYVGDYPYAYNNTGPLDSLTVNEYTLGGSLVNSFSGGSVGAFGGSLAFDSSGNLFVAGNGRVSEYSSTGTFEAMTSLSNFSPLQLATDTAGNVYVTTIQQQVVKLSPSLASSATFANTMPIQPSGIAVGSNGNVYVSLPNSVNNTYNSTGTLLYNTTNNLGGSAYVLGADGYLYTTRAPWIYRANLPEGTWTHFAPINNTSIAGALWLAEAIAVPEPASLALLCLGGLALIRLARSRRSRC